MSEWAPLSHTMLCCVVLVQRFSVPLSDWPGVVHVAVSKASNDCFPYSEIRMKYSYVPSVFQKLFTLTEYYFVLLVLFWMLEVTELFYLVFDLTLAGICGVIAL